MKLLITGGAGFIGSSFIRHLLDNQQDIEVTNFDCLTYAGNLGNLSDTVHKFHVINLSEGTLSHPKMLKRF